VWVPGRGYDNLAHPERFRDRPLNDFLSQCCGDLVALNSIHAGCMPGLLGISVTAVGRDFIQASMPVDERTTQPFGILHGGASVTLAETLGSIASWLLVSGQPGARVAGVEVNASHLKAVDSGKVTGVCRPLRIGRTLHFWHIDISDDRGARCCTARLTVSISVPGGDSPAC
jgi:1,4-dihydroxy-2-naphthoyl-CoA hydrolase